MSTTNTGSAARLAAKAHLAAQTAEQRAARRQRVENLPLRLRCPDCGQPLDHAPGPRADGRCSNCRSQVGRRRRHSEPTKRKRADGDADPLPNWARV